MTTEPDAQYKHYIDSPNGDGFWLVCDRPFADAATDMLRSAMRACKPVPSVLGNRRQPLRPAPVLAVP